MHIEEGVGMDLDAMRAKFEMLEEEIDKGPIVPAVTPEEIRGYLSARYDFSTAIPLDDLIQDVEHMLQTWQVQVTHPRYFGLFNPSVTFASVVADTLTALYNPQLASWRTSPAANEIERHTLGWLAARFGLPGNAIATFTTGGSEANQSAVIVALTSAFPDYAESGVRCIQGKPAIYLTEHAHQSFGKVAHMTGLGRGALRFVASDRHLKLDVGDLKRQVGEDRKNGFAPFMVVGTCGTTAAGAIDPLADIGSFCREEGLWFHADAAWGGAAIVSPALRHHLAGIECSDSITCDAHKWFSVPMGCGMFFCSHPDKVAEAFRSEAIYMPGKAAGTAFDPYTSSVQWSRRFIGLKLFLTLAQQGQTGQAAMIDHQTRMGNLLRDELIGSGWRIVNETPLPLICFTRDGLDVPKFLASLRESQIAWMAEAQLFGQRVVRACITSFKTTESDIRWVVNEMNCLVMQNCRGDCS
jgi:aromatic-L-amino-acid decarboxylase